SPLALLVSRTMSITRGMAADVTMLPARNPTPSSRMFMTAPHRIVPAGASHGDLEVRDAVEHPAPEVRHPRHRRGIDAEALAPDETASIGEQRLEAAAALIIGGKSMLEQHVHQQCLVAVGAGAESHGFVGHCNAIGILEDGFVSGDGCCGPN